MAWQLVEDKGTKYFQYKWQNKFALYSTKYGGNVFLEKFKPTFLKQIHSDKIINLTVDNNLSGDGLISEKNGHALGIKIADCLPVYLFNDKKICIIHCGWRGIIKGIAKEASSLMGAFKYVLGASIGPCCYEIENNVVEFFVDDYRNALLHRNNKYFLDLKIAVIEDLGNKNLLTSLNLCTKCHPEHFFSLRHGDYTNRNYAAILAV